MQLILIESRTNPAGDSVNCFFVCSQVSVIVISGTKEKESLALNLELRAVIP